MKDLAVTVRNLSKRFGNFEAVRSISFDVKRGEIFGFLGPNGAGKSTTIKMLCGLLKPSSGDGTVLGNSITHDNMEIRRSIGYMSQKFSLYNDLTVKENLEFYGSLYRIPRNLLFERIDSALREENLTAYLNSLAGSLPGGVKQKLALSAATLHDPGILFLDEPTSGVDPKSRRKFWDLIYRYAHEGKTIFVTTHYMDEAEHCGRIAMIIGGSLIALDSPDHLKSSLEYGILSVQTKNSVTALDKLTKELGLDAAIFGSDIHVITDRTAAVTKEIRRVLKDGLFISLEKIPPTLEDLFVIRARRS